MIKRKHNSTLRDRTEFFQSTSNKTKSGRMQYGMRSLKLIRLISTPRRRKSWTARLKRRKKNLPSKEEKNHVYSIVSV